MKKLLSARAYLVPQLGATLLIGLALRWVVGLEPVWWLVWLVPAPLLSLAYRASWGRALVLTALAAGIGASVNASYYQQVMPLPAVAAVVLAQTLAWVFVVGATRRLVVRYQAWWTVFVYPVLWVAVDTLLAALLPDGNWGSLAYSQAAFLPALQAAALLGVGGVLFLVALFPAALALACTYGGRLHRPAWAYGTVAGLVIAALGYGAMRLRTVSTGPETTFGLVAIDNYLEPDEAGPQPVAVWQQYAQHVAALARRGAQVVVLPEKIGEYSPQQAAAIRQRLAGLARQHRIWLEAGIGLQEDGQRRNMLWLFTPQGALLADYQKHHLAPPERMFTVGHAFEVRPVEGATYGLAICKDMHFAPLGRAYGQRQAAVMLVPAWDFTTDAQMALNITAARGVENGYLIVRPSRQGFLTVSDAYGRVLHRASSRPLPGAILLARVAVPARQDTFFTRRGYAFGWLCVAAAAGLLVVGRHKPQFAPVLEMSVFPA